MKRVLGAGICLIGLILLFVSHAQATDIITVGPFNVDICCGDWSTHTRASVPLMSLNTISFFDTNMYAYDQGMWSQNPDWTHAFVQLTVNDSSLWWVQVAGAVHTPAWYAFTADAGQLAALNGAIGGID